MYTKVPLVGYLAQTVAAGTTGPTVVIAAPGPNNRLRIVGVHVTLTQAVAVATQVAAFLNDGSAIAQFRASLEWNGMPSFAIPIPEPGIQLPDNTALTATNVGTAAAGQIVYVVYYFIDQVT